MSSPTPATLDEARAIPLNKIQTRLMEALDRPNDAGIADAVDTLISQGAYHGASDLHLEPWAEVLSDPLPHRRDSSADRDYPPHTAC
jgi:type II secretory ATPase GspE/PulE/Tfp pilus assembly ATPase PilB-like protein